MYFTGFQFAGRETDFRQRVAESGFCLIALGGNIRTEAMMFNEAKRTNAKVGLLCTSDEHVRQIATIMRIAGRTGSITLDFIAWKQGARRHLPDGIMVLHSVQFGELNTTSVIDVVRAMGANRCRVAA